MVTSPKRYPRPSEIKSGYPSPMINSNPSERSRQTVAKPWFQRIAWKKMIVSLVFVYVVVNVIGGCFSILELKKQELAVNTQLQAAQADQVQLEEMVAYMASDEAVEKLAREKLGLIKPGEIMIMRADDASAQ